MLTYDSLLSVITQVIIEMPTLWLVENYPISRRNNSTQGNYDNEETGASSVGSTDVQNGLRVSSWCV